MISEDVRARYKPTIGIECHVQLKTKSKLFSGAGNDARDAPSNTLVNHIDFGLPGALPVLNQEAVRLASLAAFALNTQPQSYSIFERKHYFYPDLPMGYQISQLSQPIIKGGSVSFEVEGQNKQVNLDRAQLEADAGKNSHPAGKDYSLVDLNRAGTPLLEIVSQPEMHSAAEAKAYVRELYLLMRFSDVSDCNLYYGNMRFDVNVSVSQTDHLGVRTETKNLNSFRSVEKAVEYEIERQIELLEKGQVIVQETRGWDEAKQKTTPQRTKEEAHDYRYMPEPDIPPIILSDEYIMSRQAEMPVLPGEWRQRLQSLGLAQMQIETLLEAEVDIANANYLDLLQAALDRPDFARQLANWLVNIDIPLIRGRENPPAVDRKALYAQVHELYSADQLSSTAAKSLITNLLCSGDLPPSLSDFAKTQGLIQQSDETVLKQIVEEVIANNQKAANDVRAGEEKAVGFLVGQVMKESKGQANPQLVQNLLKQLLN